MGTFANTTNIEITATLTIESKGINVLLLN
jgi:hypothetical protein